MTKLWMGTLKVLKMCGIVSLIGAVLAAGLSVYAYWDKIVTWCKDKVCKVKEHFA